MNHRLGSFAVELNSSWGRGAATVGIAGVLFLMGWLLGRGAGRAFDDPQQSYNARRLIRSGVWIAWLVSLVLIWRPLGGSLAPALGLATAGVAFAMQEVIGAIAGWFNITFGSIFRVGDRVEMAGVHGDVIDISLLKTRLMEIGSAGGATWVQGNQFTGRVVTVSNKATFTEPVFNYSSFLAVRFVVPIRSARSVEDDVVRQIHSSLQKAGIEVVATSVIQTATNQWQPVSSIEVDGEGTHDDADTTPADDGNDRRRAR
jgi:hypothetical protein